MLTVAEWVKQPIEARRGREVPYILGPKQFKRFAKTGVDMTPYAIHEPIPVARGPLNTLKSIWNWSNASR